jgi:hypothetical protein
MVIVCYAFNSYRESGTNQSSLTRSSARAPGDTVRRFDTRPAAPTPERKRTRRSTTSGLPSKR